MKLKELLPALVILATLTSIVVVNSRATVSSTTTTQSYACDGSTTEFTFTFPIVASADLGVYVRLDSDGSYSQLTETTDYTVAATNNDYSNGGVVTTVATHAATYTLFIVRETALTQSLDLVPHTALPAETLEAAIDRLTLLVQQNSARLDRALLVPPTDANTGLNLELANEVNRAGKYLGFDATTGRPEMLSP
jgi:hypothetical protein